MCIYCTVAEIVAKFLLYQTCIMEQISNTKVWTVQLTTILGGSGVIGVWQTRTGDMSCLWQLILKTIHTPDSSFSGQALRKIARNQGNSYPWKLVPRTGHTQYKSHPGPFVPNAIRTRDNSYTKQRVPRTSHTQSNLYRGQIVPSTTNTQGNSYPRQLVRMTTQIQDNLCQKQ